MSAPQVIATDLDGTLLGPGRVVTERTRSALRAARERGVAVVAVTARPQRVFDEWTDLASVLDAAICVNGAVTFAPATRTVIAMRAMQPETVALAAKSLLSALPSMRFAVETGGEVVLEISASGVSKAAALADWCASRGVGPEGVVAFGDAPNDVPMLAWAGRSFAVANAHPEAVAAATGRCGSNADDGVAAAVESLLR
jgi:hydroxymethylpyrimidine pyrophosphatase-like HAD family hydrolase